jgi:hypothetical protein
VGACHLEALQAPAGSSGRYTEAGGALDATLGAPPIEVRNLFVRVAFFWIPVPCKTSRAPLQHRVDRKQKTEFGTRRHLQLKREDVKPAELGMHFTRQHISA